jgi:hypothetical protein
MKSSRSFLGLLAIFAAVSSSAAAVKDDQLEFLHRMENGGFSDVAVDYLNGLALDPDNAPPSIMRVWELEMSKAKREKAKSGAYGPAEAKRLLQESKGLVEKFLEKNPDLPEAIQAAAEWSAEEAIQAQVEVLRAQAINDKDQRHAMLAKARETFVKIRPQFVKALEAAAKLRDSLSRRASPRQKQEALLRVGEGRLRVAMIDFYLALTQPAASERKGRFEQVAKEFEEIYKAFNGDFVGWQAHYWNARILQEEGRNAEARDYYEEVQANDQSDVPDAAAGDRGGRAPRAPRKSQPDWDDNFFSEVERQFLKVLYAVDRNGETGYYKEIEDWRKTHAPNRETCTEFQGLTLDYARHAADAMKDAKTDAKKQEWKRLALRLLGEMMKVRGPYQPDAVELRRQLNPNATGEDSFDGFVIDANKAVEKKEWTAAAELFGKALAAVTPKTDKTRAADARNAYVGCVHNQALDLNNKHHPDEAVDLIKKLLSVPENRQSAAAPAAALFALNVLYYQLRDPPFGTDEEKRANDAAMAKVVALARSMIAIHEWTAKEEADSARIILLRVALSKCDAADLRVRAAGIAAANAKAKGAQARSKGRAAEVKAAETESAKAAADAKNAAADAKAELAEADRIFKEINPDSRKYPEALTILGWKHWHKYRLAKRAWEEQHEKAPPDKIAQDQLDDDRKQAVDYTQNAVERLARARAPGTPMSRELRDAKVLLAEMLVEGNDAKAAVGHYKDILDDIYADPAAKAFDDPATLPAFNGAVQAYMQLGDVRSAAAVGTKLLETGPDVVSVNGSIINFAKRLEQLRKQAVGAGDSASQPPVDPQAIVDLEAKIMINLAKREQLAIKPQLPNTMIWIAKGLSQLGSDDADAAATQLIGKIIDKAQNDDDFDKQVRKYMTYLRSLSFNLEAKHGNYAKAYDDVTALVQQNRKVLPPQMSQAQILTEWAARDSAKYADAVNAWKLLCLKLERVKVRNKANNKEEKMPEYYEAVYQRSFCYFKMYEKTKDKQNARDGLDFLTPVLSFDPKLQGKERDSELVYKYYQLAGKLADCLDVPRPKPPAK